MKMSQVIKTMFYAKYSAIRFGRVTQVNGKEQRKLFIMNSASRFDDLPLDEQAVRISFIYFSDGIRYTCMFFNPLVILSF